MKPYVLYFFYELDGIKMKIKVVCVGKIKENFTLEGIVYYKKIISKKYHLDIIELPDEKIPENASCKTLNIVKKKESSNILKKIHKNDFVVLLDVQAKIINSTEFINIFHNTDKNIVFVIGGSLGVDDVIKERANVKISLSKMTFTHQFMRIILLEQLSRLK